MKYSSLPLEQIQSWTVLNNVELHGIEISPNMISEDGISKGGGIVSTKKHTSGEVLLKVPHDLILCKEQIAQSAKSDQHFRELVDSLGDFIETPRKSIMIFLLMQMTISSPSFGNQSVGVKSFFTEYFRFLPKSIHLPTFYSSAEQEMLIGTSLSYALTSKLASLQKEFDALKERTTNVKWCQRLWWSEEEGQLTFEDWLLVDALYRSRALELPSGIGDAMVPVLDMANHGSTNHYNARFEPDQDGNITLVVQDGKEILDGDEIMISYGRGGASEMIFSYGFLERDVISAREMFLTLDCPDDDPLQLPKRKTCLEPPGVRIFVNPAEQMGWESGFVWWICVNEEDGLDFEILQTIDGGRELAATWKGSSLNPNALKPALMNDPKKDIFMLRAVVTIQGRIEEQGGLLSSTDEDFDKISSCIPANQRHTCELIRQLRRLELKLLVDSFSALEVEKQELLNSRTVGEYLAGDSNLHETEGQVEDDFS